MSSKCFFGSRFAMSLADQFLLFVVPIMVFQFTQSIAWSSFAFALETLPRVIAYPLAGLISDRYPCIKMVSLSLWFRSIACTCAILITWVLGEQAVLSIVITLSAVSGVASVQGFMSSEVLLPVLFKKLPFAKVQAKVQSVDQMSIIGGPLLAALVLQCLNWQSVLMVAGGLFVLAQALFSLSHKSFVSNLEPKPLIFNDDSSLKSGLSLKLITHQLNRSYGLIIKNDALLMIIAQTALINLIYGAALATGAAFVAGKFQLPATAYGFLQMMGAITSVVVLSLTAALAERLRLKIIGIFSFFSICSGGIVYSLSESYSIFVIGFMIILGFDGMFNVYIRTIRQAVIPAVDYGKATGMIIFFNSLTKPMAGLLIAAFSNWLSAQWVILALVILTMTLGIFLFKASPSVCNLREAKF
ncbi:MAG: MFS transporter [Oceanospirillaceae bacterium]